MRDAGPDVSPTGIAGVDASADPGGVKGWATFDVIDMLAEA